MIAVRIAAPMQGVRATDGDGKAPPSGGDAQSTRLGLMPMTTVLTP
jgi:hypothetical protein